MATPLLVLIILAIVIIASIITSVKMSNPEDGQNEKETESGTFADDIWFIVRGKDRKTSEKLLEYWHFICENSEWKCIERKKKG